MFNQIKMFITVCKTGETFLRNLNILKLSEELILWRWISPEEIEFITDGFQSN